MSAPNLNQITTRRQALKTLGFAATGVSLLPDPAQALLENSDEALDEAYRLLRTQEAQNQFGLSNHAPMVAEALCALGRPEKAVAWVQGHSGRNIQLPPPRHKIDHQNWRSALGVVPGAATWEASNERWGDWREFFTRELDNGRWQDVLDVWVGRLAPGLCGAATHGVIRTSHAVRALSRRDTPERKAELARGLAYWASSYEELPFHHRAKPPAENFTKALVEVPLYWEAFHKSPEGRNIVEALRHLKELNGFGEVRELITAPKDVSAAVSALTATFTRVFMRHGSQHDTIAFVHAVTGPCSLRRMAPHIRPETARSAFPYAWQTAAAVYSAYARTGDQGTQEESKLTPPELASRAVVNGDAHAIKFTEVMFSEHKINPDPIYLAAAEQAIKRL